MRIAVREAKNNLSRYGDLAHKGEHIVVSKNGVPWFDLVPHKKTKRRTRTLDNIKPNISLEEAIRPLDPEDIPGWI